MDTSNWNGTSPAEEEVVLYHEQQRSRLCATHALNTLLQEPAFTDVQLIQESAQLDEQERQLLGGSSLDSTGEANSSMYGDFFNVQVVHILLNKRDLHAVRVSAPEGRAALASARNERAFILNSSEHWWTVRQVDVGRAHQPFFDFNSNKPAPEEVSDTYLEAQIAQIHSDGGNVFAIRGHLPESQASSVPRHLLPIPNDGGQWLTLGEAKQRTADAHAAQVRGRSLQAIDDLMAKSSSSGSITLGKEAQHAQNKHAAAAPSMDNAAAGDAGLDSDTDLQIAIQASLASQDQAAVHSGAVPAMQQQQTQSNHDEAVNSDPDLEKAIQMSLE